MSLLPFLASVWFGMFSSEDAWFSYRHLLAHTDEQEPEGDISGSSQSGMATPLLDGPNGATCLLWEETWLASKAGRWGPRARAGSELGGEMDEALPSEACAQLQVYGKDSVQRPCLIPREAVGCQEAKNELEPSALPPDMCVRHRGAPGSPHGLAGGLSKDGSRIRVREKGLKAPCVEAQRRLWTPAQVAAGARGSRVSPGRMLSWLGTEKPKELLKTPSVSLGA